MSLTAEPTVMSGKTRVLGGITVIDTRASQTPFLTGDQNEAYRAAEPKDDARFIAVFAHSLEHTGGLAPEDAKRVAATLLPDLLPLQPHASGVLPAEWPQSQRRRRGCLPDCHHQWETDGRWDRPPRRSARRVSLPGAASQRPIARGSGASSSNIRGESITVRPTREGCPARTGAGRMS
jgi:hypothetical protein